MRSWNSSLIIFEQRLQTLRFAIRLNFTKYVTGWRLSKNVPLIDKRIAYESQRFMRFLFARKFEIPRSRTRWMLSLRMSCTRMSIEWTFPFSNPFYYTQWAHQCRGTKVSTFLFPLLNIFLILITLSQPIPCNTETLVICCTSILSRNS